jgi:hypothetical protein
VVATNGKPQRPTYTFPSRSREKAGRRRLSRFAIDARYFASDVRVKRAAEIMILADRDIYAMMLFTTAGAGSVMLAR